MQLVKLPKKALIMFLLPFVHSVQEDSEQPVNSRFISSALSTLHIPLNKPKPFLPYS